MSMSEPRFRVVTPQQLREIRRERKIKKTHVVLVNRREYFQPYRDTLRRYLRFRERYGERPRANEFALSGVNYASMYRRKIVSDGKALSHLRSLAKKSRESTVYFVKENERPDCEILVDICKTFMRQGIW